MRTLAMVAAVLAASAAAARAQDFEQGQASFKKCALCHSIGPDAQDKVGPQLNGLDGRKAGTAPGFLYSDAQTNSGITWNEASFKQYIKDPKAAIPGTKKVFAGIKDEQEAGNLWAYLSRFNADGSEKQ